MREPLIREAHRDPACTVHPHCVCGALLDDDGTPELVCVECGTTVPIGAEVRVRVEVTRS